MLDIVGTGQIGVTLIMLPYTIPIVVGENLNSFLKLGNFYKVV